MEKQNAEVKSLVDADKFPIYYKSEKLIKEYETVWDWNPNLISKISDKVGFHLLKKESSIEHHEAGNGVFLMSDAPVLPGTFLGFYPGVIRAPGEPLPNTKWDVRPYLVWIDQYWIDPDIEIPYFYNQG